jgi:hypothetical protein
MAIYTKKTIWASTTNRQTVEFTFSKEQRLAIVCYNSGGIAFRIVIQLRFGIDSVVKTAVKDAAVEIAKHFGISAVEEAGIAKQIHKMISDYL